MSTDTTQPHSALSTAVISTFLGHTLAWVAFLLIGFVYDSAATAFEFDEGFLGTVFLAGYYSFVYWLVSIPIVSALFTGYLRYRAPALKAASLGSARREGSIGGAVLGIVTAVLLFAPLSRAMFDMRAVAEGGMIRLVVVISLVAIVYGAICGWFLVTLYKERGRARAA